MLPSIAEAFIHSIAPRLLHRECTCHEEGEEVRGGRGREEEGEEEAGEEGGEEGEEEGGRGQRILTG